MALPPGWPSGYLHITARQPLRRVQGIFAPALTALPNWLLEGSICSPRHDLKDSGQSGERELNQRLPDPYHRAEGGGVVGPRNWRVKHYCQKPTP